MKILLAALNSKFVHSNLAIRYLKSFCNEFDIQIYESTINENPFDIALDIAITKYDVVGFSCYIWNIENTLKVCSILKEIDENIKILLGGPEVSYNPKEVLEKNKFVDYVVFGEGEETFKELLQHLNGEKEISSVDGIAYRINNNIVVNNERELIKNLDKIPFPYEEFPQKILYYEASRGCPFNCKYCLSSTIRGIRFFSLDRVKRDLKCFIDNKVKLVKFVDRTFNANKKFSIEIWNYLIENADKTKFHFEIAADLLDDECLRVLRKAPEGLFQFEIGVQTTNPDVLKSINRVMDFEKVKKNVLKLKELKNIHCHLDLIVGLPGEDINSFEKSFDDLMKLKPDVLQIGFLKILKGSPVSFESEKYGIKYSKYPPYQVLKTDKINLEQMIFLLKFEEIFETFYNSGIFKITLGYFLSRIQNYQFFKELTLFLDNLNYFNKNHDLNSKFELLKNFLISYEGIDIVKDLMIHDYLITTKKTYVPEFLKKEEINLKEIAKTYGEDKKIDFNEVKRMIAFTTNISYEFEEYKIGRKVVIFNPSRQIYFYINLN